MRKILHLADLHLGFEHRYLGERAGQRAEEAVQTLERVAEWAVDDRNDIGAVLIAGDLFETHEPDAQLTGRVITTLRRITGAGRELVTVPGNHDEYSYPESIYRARAATWPGVLVTQPAPEAAARFELDGAPCTVFAMAYTAGLSPTVLPALPPADQVDEVRIAVLHGTLDAAPADRSYRIDSATLSAGGIAYAALGHIHTPSETRLRGGVAVYPGTLNGKGFDDPGVEELVTVSFAAGTPRVERVPFPVRPIESRPIDLAHFETTEEILDHLEAQAQSNLILRLRPFGPRPSGFDAEYVLGRLKDLFFHVEINDQSIDVPPEEIEQLAQQRTIQGLFVRIMRERLAEADGDPAAFENIRRER
jgi:exonuclease SbcD